MRRPLAAAAAVALAAALALPAVSTAATPGPAGTTLAPAGVTATAPLRADAGDSGFAPTGDFAPLLGTGYGGTGLYSFAWTVDGGEVTTPDQASTLVDTTDVAPGRYTATLTVTDTAGAVAEDTVEVVVVEAAAETPLLDETVEDLSPGVGSEREFPVEVPAGLSALNAGLSWANPANDYDLNLVDPDGKVRATSGNSPPRNSESVAVADPVAGTWKVVAVRFATVAETDLTATAVGASAVTDPGPVIDAGGPYRFVDGARQSLTGTVAGGTAPYTTGWDVDLDGEVDLAGTDVTAALPAGRHLVVFRATDADGLERQRMTSVLVGTPEQVRAQQVPITVIGIADSGINFYHQEFSAATYPDPRVLELTNGFTRHPSEYIEGYPRDAEVLPVSQGKGFFPKEDEYLFNANDYIEAGQLYWVPGTKVVGAVEAGGSTGATSGEDVHPILDDNGHGTGSSSVSAGNRYGYCPTCLIVNVEALDETVVAGMDWVDFSSNSFGYVGGAPLGPLFGTSEETKAAAERGQTTLFAAGNGIGNAFDVPISTYGSDQTGPDWNITVGALRRDNQGAIVGDGIPADISAWGDGNLPSACRATTIAQCAFGGTSAATPYTAGVFGTVLTQVRQVLGDGRSGQRPGQVVAKGTPVAGSEYLSDGELTRQELKAAVLKTAQPLNETSGQNPKFAFPTTYTGPQARYAFEGYGAATPNSASRAIAVLLGEREMPARPEEDEFAREVCAQRDSLTYGGPYDRTGNGELDPCSADYHSAERFIGEGEPTTEPAAPGLAAYDPARATVDAQPSGEPFTYFLHRTFQIGSGDPNEPQADPDDMPGDGDVEQSCGDDSEFMTRDDRTGDLEPCFESRITSVVASFRPLGIWAAPDTLDAPLPAGSTVEAEIYLASNDGGAAELRGVLNATDREIGRGGTTGVLTPTGDPEVCEAQGEACWTKYAFTFQTERPAAAGEQLTFQAQQTGTRSYAYGYEGEHRSKFTVTPAASGEGLEFGVTVDEPAAGAELPSEPFTARGTVAFPALGADPQNAGFHPSVEQVQLSVDDPAFQRPLYAVVDRTTGRWSVDVPALSPGERTLRVRALRDRTPSPATAVQASVAGFEVPDRPGDEGPDDGGQGALPPKARPIVQACPEDRVPRNSREDSRGNLHERAIDCMIWYEIARGYDDRFYGPSAAVSREQMASFVARHVEVSGGGFPAERVNAFSDDAGSVHEENIDKLASVGIVKGTGDGRFDPHGPITRDQMATFLIGAYEYRTGTTITPRGDYFADDAGNTHEVNINKSAEVGFTGGRDGGYDPGAEVNRDAMASFLARTYALLVEQGIAQAKS